MNEQEKSEYELQRERNIEGNKAFLSSLGLEKGLFRPPARRTKKKDLPTRSLSPSSSSSSSTPRSSPPSSGNSTPRSSQAKQKLSTVNVTNEVNSKGLEAWADDTRRISSRKRQSRDFFSNLKWETKKRGPAKKKRTEQAAIAVEIVGKPESLQRGCKIELTWSCEKYPEVLHPDLYIILIKSYYRTEWSLMVKVPGSRAYETVGTGSEKQNRLAWTMPLSVPTGTGYRFEVGSHRLNALGFSPPLEVTSPVGMETGSEVGVWCRCGLTKYGASTSYCGRWIECSVCSSWQHAGCYFRGNKKHFHQTTFLCVWCDEKRSEEDGQMVIKRSNITRMLQMIKKASVGYRRKERNLTVVLKTPAIAVNFLATLLKETDRRCIDLGSGSGALSAVLPEGTKCVEIRKSLITKGQACKETLEHVEWVHADVLSRKFIDKFICETRERFDLVVSNPVRFLVFFFLSFSFSALHLI